MDLEDGPADVAQLVVPGVVGLGAGTFVGLATTGSFPLAAVLALVGAVAGHGVGFYLVREA